MRTIFYGTLLIASILSLHAYGVEYFTVEDESTPTVAEKVPDSAPIEPPFHPRLTPMLERGKNAISAKRWGEAIGHLRKIISHDPAFATQSEVFYYLGIALFNTCEDHCANQSFTQYLQSSQNPAHFNDAIKYKFMIAERYRSGQRKRLYGLRALPRFANTQEDALDLYDEVTTSLPYDELSAYALYSKGWLLEKMGDYRSSIDTFQTLIYRFPKHEIIPQTYYAIITVYAHQSYIEYQNPDFLALAEIQLDQFKEEYPNDPLVAEAEAELMQIKEIQSWGLYKTGGFYERLCQPQAAALYYANAINLFPNTCIAEKCRRHLYRLLRCYPCIEVPCSEL